MANETFIGSPNYTKGRGNYSKPTMGVVHWIVGDLASADAVFQNTSRQTSAHKGIENNEVHIYVRDEDTAYHAGNWDVNQRSIGIENSAAPGRDASPATLETLAQEVAKACKKYGIPCDRAHWRRHGEIVPTQCCGTINVDAVVNRAAQILGGAGTVAQPSQPVPLPLGDNVINWVGKVTVVGDTLNVRSRPHASAPLSGSKTLKKGDTFNLVGYTVAQDPYGDGRNIWVKSEFGNWVWSGGTTFTLGGAKPNPVAAGGRIMVIHPSGLQVRSQPKTSAPGNQANTPDGMLHYGNIVDYKAEVHGELVNQNGRSSDIWYQSVRGNYFSSVWCNKY